MLLLTAGSRAKVLTLDSDGGIVVSIAAFQAVDLGSIPSHRRGFLPIPPHQVCLPCLREHVIKALFPQSLLL